MQCEPCGLQQASAALERRLALRGCRRRSRGFPSIGRRSSWFSYVETTGTLSVRCWARFRRNYNRIFNFGIFHFGGNPCFSAPCLPHLPKLNFRSYKFGGSGRRDPFSKRVIVFHSFVFVLTCELQHLTDFIILFICSVFVWFC